MDKVKESAVLDLVDTEKTNVQPYIDSAHFLAEPLDLSVDQRQEIEKWLAAHFLKVDEGELKDKEVQNSSESYTKKTGQGLRGTTYGQQALALDTTGELEGGSGAEKVKFKSTGV